MKSWIRNALRAIGVDLERHPPRPQGPTWPIDVSAEDAMILERIAEFTMTSTERQISLIQSVRHLVRHRIPGSIVECGVWRGGSCMAAALALINEGDTSRSLYLFDTFEGMTPPNAVDRRPDGILAQTILDSDPDKAGYVWAVAPMDVVRRNMESTGYPADRVKYVKGPIESTVPSQAPLEPIALLRLDTDWYESTRHELEHLFPRLTTGGILIIDDYGDWEGARRAVDEYFAARDRPYYLHRIDPTGRLVVKA